MLLFGVLPEPACSSQLLDVLPELAIERMACQRGNIAENDDFHSGAGNSDVHAAQVAQKTNFAIVVGAYHGYDNDVTLLALETVNGVDGDETAERLEELALHEQPAQELNLSTIG